MSSSKPESNPETEYSCPNCGNPTGVPFSVMTEGPGKLVVSLRCSACRHEWQQERELPESGR